RYDVFIDGKSLPFYESQIEKNETKALGQVASIEHMNAALSSAQICQPGLNNLFSLRSARIDFIPYQYRPVLKLIRSDRPRLLIADEVGVGKTIEAGLILKELSARSDINSVLIICPKPLVNERKWMNEMRRFDEEFVHLNSEQLKYCIEETDNDGVWPLQYSKAILPFSLCDEKLLYGSENKGRKRLGLNDLDPPPEFDLVIIDEAHHIRNASTQSHEVAKFFCDYAGAVVMLSATPIQTKDEDLFNLLHVLRPDSFTTPRDFEHQAEPNQFINTAIEHIRGMKGDYLKKASASLDSVLSTSWGVGVLRKDPCFQDIYDALKDGDLSSDRRLSILRELEGLYTFSNIINRTRRRDIGVFTTRKPETLEVAFTADQEEVYQGLLDLIGQVLRLQHGDQSLPFLMSTLQRQAASCIYGLAPFLNDIIHRRLSSLEDSDYDNFGIGNAYPALEGFKEEIERFIARVEQIDLYDPKLEAFLTVVEQKRQRDNKKLLVFTGFLHTLEYIYNKLIAAGIRVGRIEGKVSEDERRDLRARFSMSSEDASSIDVLLSTEVGAEGLDYQFCDAIVNYDIPWNPMKVEQRIGRIDRYGQKSKTVAIYNLITTGTIDAEIYSRCLLRVGVFRNAIGGSEEILGQITAKLRDIADRFELTDAERHARLKQLEDNEIRKIHEQDLLEEEQSKLFGLDVPLDDDLNIESARTYWLSAESIYNLVDNYIRSLRPDANSRSRSNKLVHVIRLNQDMKDKLLRDHQSIDSGGMLARKWGKWLKGDESILRVTYDDKTAQESPDVTFLTALHPLVKQAAKCMNPEDAMLVSLKTSSEYFPSGSYQFAIYAWEKRGFKTDFEFKVVCDNPQVAEHLVQHIEELQQASIGRTLSEGQRRLLEQSHYQLWVDERACFLDQESTLAEMRVQSLETTYRARLNQAEDKYASAEDPKIRRMHGSTMNRIEADVTRRRAEAEIKRSQFDLLAQPLVWGTLEVTS
ncbi:MAG: SNF2-related protein, partial [Burkholderiales bacterium]|nr:SNF2-related protein [Burkholderiales bacterium]